MARAPKATVRLGGTLLAGVGSIAWKFVTGTQPYTSVFSVHREQWNELKNRVGEYLDLEVRDSRDVTITVRDLTILHELPSDGPKRVSFVVADKRWKWAYPFIARDYNIPKKTGDRTAKNDVPIEQQVVVDEYDFRPYSLDGSDRWEPERAVEDVLEILTGAADEKDSDTFVIESFPINTKSAGVSGEGQFSLQNIILRDQGDVAMARLLSYIPGASVYVDAEGTIRVFDGTDMGELERYYNELPANTWDGDKSVFVDRKAIRPEDVAVYYQRELELVLEYEDAYLSGSGRTRDGGFQNSPFIDNVIPTVDPETVITEYDPVEGGIVEKTVPPGTYVQVESWLQAMDDDKPEGSLPWTWDTIKRHWLKGDLDGALGGRGLDLDPDGNVSMRIQALKQHFRQTFRINRLYVERVRDIQSIRVGLLDPITGARQPAAVWGQACVIPTTKGKYMANRNDESQQGVFRNVDYLPDEGQQTIDAPPGPARVTFKDRDLGIFRLDWITSPYGTVESFVPCHLVGEADATVPRVPTRDLSRQDDDPMGAGMKIEEGTNGIFLRDTLEFRIMVTVVPAAPNNKAQFHKRIVKASDISDLYRTEYNIKDGQGPRLEVFVAPGESTARYAWEDDQAARSTISRVLGLDGDSEDAGLKDDPDTEDDESERLEGYVLINARRELLGHANAVAAEAIAAFADSLMGRATTRLPDQGLRLRGNMSGATLQIAAAPSAKVNAVHEFPGQPKPISRLALMPEATRHVVLGVLPYGNGA